MGELGDASSILSKSLLAKSSNYYRRLGRLKGSAETSRLEIEVQKINKQQRGPAESYNWVGKLIVTGLILI